MASVLSALRTTPGLRRPRTSELRVRDLRTTAHSLTASARAHLPGAVSPMFQEGHTLAPELQTYEPRFACGNPSSQIDASSLVS